MNIIKSMLFNSKLRMKYFSIQDKLSNKYINTNYPDVIKKLHIENNKILKKYRLYNAHYLILNSNDSNTISTAWNEYISRYNEDITKINFFIKILFNFKKLKLTELKIQNCPIIYNNYDLYNDSKFIILGTSFNFITEKKTNEMNTITLRLMDKTNDNIEIKLNL